MKIQILRTILICLLASAGLVSDLLPTAAVDAVTQSSISTGDRPLTGVDSQTYDPHGPLPTDQIIIKYRLETLKEPAVAATDAQMDRLTRTAGIDLAYFRQMSGDAHVLKLPTKLPEAEVAAIARRLAKLPEVEYAEPDRIALPTSPAVVPNDPQYANQWYLSGANGINAPTSWDVTTGSATVIVAVIDTGIVFNHTDLAGRTINGFDFISDTWTANDGNGRDADATDPGDWVAADDCRTGDPAEDSSWHGTHVAGTIGAAANNGTGVAGVDWNARILGVRVLGRCGGGAADIADAIRWSAGLAVPNVPNNTNPARVLNLSLGGLSTTCDNAYQDAINDARNANTVVVVAAGNDNGNASNQQPANCNGVITVAATDSSGDRASFSNFGSVVEISAPGVSILSTVNGSMTAPNTTHIYSYYDGTSMATPQIAGVASLVLGLRPALTPQDVQDVLQNSVIQFPSGSTCNTSDCGTGIVDATLAVRDLYVQSSAAAGGIGSANRPFQTVGQANGAAWNGAWLRIRSGSYPEALTISRRVELRAEGGLVTIGR